MILEWYGYITDLDSNDVYTIISSTLGTPKEQAIIPKTFFKNDFRLNIGTLFKLVIIDGNIKIELCDKVWTKKDLESANEKANELKTFFIRGNYEKTKESSKEN